MEWTRTTGVSVSLIVNPCEDMEFYYFRNTKSRGWLKDLLVAESDSESEGEPNFSEKDLHALLKVGVCADNGKMYL